MKKVVCMVICIVLAFALFSACSAPAADPVEEGTEMEASSVEEQADEESTTQDGERIRIGVAFYDLNDPFWAETANGIEECAKEYDCDVTVLSAEINAATQVSQLENMIQSGVDALIIGAVDVATVADVTKRALDDGIVVVAYCFSLENETAEIIIDEYDMGYKCGEMAANFINEKLNGKAQIGMLDLPLYPNIVVRADAMIEAVADLCPESEYVMTDGTGATVETGLTATESFLQAYPDMKVITSISEGAAIGAMEAFKGAGKAGDDTAAFGCGGNMENLQSIKDGEMVRGTVAVGSAKQRADMLFEVCFNALNGKQVEKYQVFPNVAVTAKNLDEYCQEAGITLE